MAANDELLSQILAVLPADREVRTTDLRLLFQTDPESVYQAAVGGISTDAPIAARGLECLARTLSVLMRDGFSIESAANQQYARGRQGGILPLDEGQADLEFIQRLYTGSAYASKMESQKRSRACLDFFLEEHVWDCEIRNTLPLRIAPQDAQAILDGLPRYQFAALLDSAREVVRCPTVVYKGLRHDGPMKSDGLAFCGIPSRRHMNVGEPLAPPHGFVFGVFANAEGHVFDWDWIPASTENPLLPRNAEERFPFGTPVEGIRGELLLGNVRGKSPAPFRPQRATHSRPGDCVFWYLSDAEAYADRYDEYLTAFFDARNLEPNREEKDKCVGFKLKNVGRLFETIQQWARPDSNEGIFVEFDLEQDPIRVELLFLMQAWAKAALPTKQELLPGMRLMELLGVEGVNALRDSTLELSLPRLVREEFRRTQAAQSR